jgi:polar amino acid transport system permease protein
MFGDDIWLVYKTSFPLLLKAAFITLWISFLGIVSGCFFGALFGIFSCDRLKKPFLSPLFAAYVAIFRGTPLFVQLLIVYFALPDALGIELSPIAAGVLTLGLNSTAYLAEIVRAGINAVDDGQWDASYILGYSRFQTFRYIILPQAIKNVLPAISNEFSTLIKESSILMVIGVPELVKTSRDIVAHNLRPMEIYLLTAAFYLLLTYAVYLLTRIVEKRAAQ